MKRSIKKQRITHIPSNPVSRYVRKFVERFEFKKILGINLTFAAITISLIEPQAQTALISPKVLAEVSVTSAEDAKVKTETTIAWPVHTPAISQGYHFGHPGIDITSADRIIHPIDKGNVIDVQFSKWVAYGNHVIVQHPNGRQSLYAHLESVKVKKGDEVTRDTEIGIMGQTGWATGIHLHLEIYQDGQTVNPLEVLPKIN